MSPRIEDWQLRADGRLHGKVFGSLTIPDGVPVVTSTVRFMDFLRGVAQTKNTLYILGNPVDGGTVYAKAEAE